MSAWLDPEVIDAAVFAHQAVPLSAQEHPARAVDQLYQDYASLLPRMDTAEWQVIYGSRGSGKTSALKTFAERSRRGALTNRSEERLLATIAVYLDAHQFRPPSLKVAPEFRAQASFRLFLVRFGNELVRTATALEARESIYARLKRPRHRASRIVREILAIVDQAEPLYPFDEVSIRTIETEERQASHGTELGAVLDVNPAEPRAAGSLRGGTSRMRRQEQAKVTERSRSGPGHPNWSQMHDLLQGFCNELRIERLDILIDNWPAIDPDGTGAVQPYFADLVLRAFSGGNDQVVAVKIAGDGFQTRLWNAEHGCGLDSDHITTVENLNYPILENEDFVAFFERMLFRRMLKNTDQLRAFLDPHTPGAPLSPKFILSLFENREAFELLVRGTEGRCRQFLHCVRDLAHATSFSVQAPWTCDQVLDVVKRRGRPGLEEMDHYSPAVRTLLRDIKPVVVGMNDRRFTITSEQAADRADDVEELRAKRLIWRPDDRDQVEAGALGRMLFHISDDLMEEWERARRFESEIREAREHRAPLHVGHERGIGELTVTLSPPLGGGA